MYRVVMLGGKPYALEISEVEEDSESIEQFVKEGNVVMLCEDLEDLEKYGIEPSEVEIVE
jgi:hypothetical protein